MRIKDLTLVHEMGIHVVSAIFNNHDQRFLHFFMLSSKVARRLEAPYDVPDNPLCDGEDIFLNVTVDFFSEGRYRLSVLEELVEPCCELSAGVIDGFLDAHSFVSHGDSNKIIAVKSLRMFHAKGVEILVTELVSSIYERP